MASQLGASATINSTEEGAAERLFELTEGGARSIVDFVGAEASVNFGYNLLAKRRNLCNCRTVWRPN